jgi:hypothetical protein
VSAVCPSIQFGSKFGDDALDNLTRSALTAIVSNTGRNNSQHLPDTETPVRTEAQYVVCWYFRPTSAK